MEIVVKIFATLFSFLLYLSIASASHANDVMIGYSTFYKITEQFGFQVNTSQMKVTVTDNHIVRELPQQNIIEHWVKRDNGRHVFYRHFPAHHSSIYYNRGDLRALSLANDWDTVSQIIPNRWLDSLELIGEEQGIFGSVSKFSGKIGEYTVSIDWNDDLQLPIKYTIRQQHQRLTMELEKLNEIFVEHEQLNEWDKFRKVDFSDAMDMERDGFVQYLIATGQLETNGIGLHTH